MSRIKRKNDFGKDFVKGIVAYSNDIMCDKCKKIIEIGGVVYTDGTNLDYDLCEKCFGDLK